MASRVFSLFVEMKAWKVIATSQNKKKRDLMGQSIGEKFEIYITTNCDLYCFHTMCDVQRCWDIGDLTEKKKKKDGLKKKFS